MKEKDSFKAGMEKEEQKGNETMERRRLKKRKSDNEKDKKKEKRESKKWLEKIHFKRRRKKL